ncbi:MAG: helix-turn-helix domain-containing protein [Candidatus Tritonobacter lacicola]|nr:helix-turn-helix domain-containing protein [Candidatus Tritonobacter lacicola]
MKRINEESEEKIPQQEWISIIDAARLAGKSSKTIYRYIRSGRISKLDDYTLAGSKKYLVRRDEIEAIFKPKYAIERVRHRGNAIEVQGKAISILRERQIRVEDTIEKARTDIRKLSMIIFFIAVTGIFIACWIVLANWYSKAEIQSSIEAVDKQGTHMSTIVQDHLERQNGQLDVQDSRLDEVENEMASIKEAREGERIEKRRKRKKFLGIF